MRLAPGHAIVHATRRRSRFMGGVQMFARITLRALTARAPRARDGRLPPIDEAYWLAHCEESRVDAPEGRIGHVHKLEFRSHNDRPDTIVVRTGWLGVRMLQVPMRDVSAVLPREHRIVVSTAGLNRSWRFSDIARMLAAVRGRAD